MGGRSRAGFRGTELRLAPIVSPASFELPRRVGIQRLDIIPRRSMLRGSFFGAQAWFTGLVELERTTQTRWLRRSGCGSRLCFEPAAIPWISLRQECRGLFHA